MERQMRHIWMILVFQSIQGADPVIGEHLFDSYDPLSDQNVRNEFPQQPQRPIALQQPHETGEVINNLVIGPRGRLTNNLSVSNLPADQSLIANPIDQGQVTGKDIGVVTDVLDIPVVVVEKPGPTDQQPMDLSEQAQQIRRDIQSLRNQLDTIAEDTNLSDSKRKLQANKELRGPLSKLKKIIAGFPEGTERDQLEEFLKQVVDALNEFAPDPSAKPKPTDTGKGGGSDSKGSGNKRPPVQVLTVEQALPKLKVTESQLSEQDEPEHLGQKLNDLCGLVRAFPELVNPGIRGEITIDNGRLTQLYEKAQDGDLVRRLFNRIGLNAPVVLSNSPVNPARGMSASLIAQLVRMTEDPKTEDQKLVLLTKLASPGGEKLLEDASVEEFFKDWYTSFKSTFGPKDEINVKEGKAEKNAFDLFRKDAREFLRTLLAHASKDAQGARDRLLMYLELRMRAGDREKMLQEYARGLQIPFSPLDSHYSEEDFRKLKAFFTTTRLTAQTIENHLDEILFYVRMSNNYLVKRRLYFDSFQKLTYEGKTFTGCKENTIRTIMNIILYNPDTGHLDLNMLPDDPPHYVRRNVPAPLREFVEKYGNLDKRSPEAEAAYLALVENKPGIIYSDPQTGNHELSGEIGNGATVLRLLFGIPEREMETSEGKTLTPQEQMEKIFEILSYKGERELSVADMAEGYGITTFKLTLSTPSKFSVAANIAWTSAHGSVDFLGFDAVINDVVINNLFLAGEALDQFVLGAYKVSLSGMVEQLIKAGSLVTEKQFLDFFKKYSSAFDLPLLQAFDRGLFWSKVFVDLPQNIFENVINAALKVGYSLSMGRKISESGLRFTALVSAVDSVSKLAFLCESGLPVSEEMVKMVLSKMSKNIALDERVAIVKTLFKYGLTDEMLRKVLFGDMGSGLVRQLPALVEAGFDLNAPDKEGITPLMGVTFMGKINLFTALVKAGADLFPKEGEGGNICAYIHTLVERGIATYSEQGSDTWDEKDWSRKLNVTEAEGVSRIITQLLNLGEPFEAEPAEISLIDTQIQQLKADQKKLTRMLEDYQG